MIPGNINTALISGAEGGYAISRSLRFNAADSAYLSRTPASAGNRKTWTWAGWVKRSALGSIQFFLGGGTTGNDTDQFVAYFTSGDTLRITTGATILRETTQVFRDPSSWYHLTIAVDTTQGTANNRVKFYVNGSEVTTFSATNNPTQNADTGINTAAFHAIGRNSLTPEYYFSGYLADVFLIDGQALTPTSFGEFSATTGVWMPKAYSGSYGTNGFHLDFSDNSTAAALGTDSSGAGNTWSVNNLSVTAGAGNDSLVDVPVNGSASSGADSGGEVRGNYCCMNPLDKSSSVTLANGSLDASSTALGEHRARGTIAYPSSGKWYYEVTMGSTYAGYVGIASASAPLTTGAGAQSYGYNEGGNFYVNGSPQSTPFASFGSGDIIGVAVDIDASTIAFYKNGTQTGSSQSISSSYTYFPLVNAYNGTFIFNFGQRAFARSGGAPSGFKALCTANLPAPLVTKPSDLFDVKLYSGNNSTQTIPLDFNPDFIWLKCRNSGRSHRLIDSVRGLEYQLFSDSTAGGNTYDGTSYRSSVTSTSSSGFVVDNSASIDQYNTSGETYAAWCWDAGTTTVTNTVGSITSQVRANASAGFSVVTFTAPSSGSATIGHGLGVEPQMIIIKSRDQTYNWCVYHKNLTSNAFFLNLNTTAAESSASNIWNNTTPTSTVFSLGSGYAGAGATVAYVFSPVAGYSSFGSYVGNGSSDGVFVYTGHRSRFVLIKSAGSEDRWTIQDTSRSPYNASTDTLAPNLSNAELANAFNLDILSNGFKVRNTNSGHNTNGVTYIWASFAENPFQYARAR